MKAYNSNETNIIQTYLGEIGRVGVAKVGWVTSRHLVCGGKCWETVIRNPASDLLYCLKVSF